MNKRVSFAGALLMALALFASAPPLAATASERAIPGGSVVVSDVNLRWCAWGTVGRCDLVGGAGGQVAAGTTVNAVCWTKGVLVTGAYRTDHWIFVANGTAKGWVHSSWVKNSGLHVQVASEPNELSSCNATRPDIASANYAMEFSNRAYMRKALALELFAADEWGTNGQGASIVGQLSGNSPKLVHYGYLRAGKTIPGAGRAVDIFNEHYASQATVAWDAPIGALMFWGPAHDNGSQGLVGLSVGNGQVFLVQGKRTVDSNWLQAARVVSAASVDSGSYLGWVKP